MKLFSVTMKLFFWEKFHCEFVQCCKGSIHPLKESKWVTDKGTMKLFFCVAQQKSLVLQAFLIKRKERKLQYRWYHNFRSYLVEARGIEPLSENHLIQLSPSAVRLLGVPSRIAGGQAMRYGSHYAVTGGVASPCSRSPLIGALFSAAVLRDRTGCIN